MHENSEHMNIYEKFLGKIKPGIPRKRRCQVCYRPYFVEMSQKGLCKRCNSYGAYLFLQNLHKESFL